MSRRWAVICRLYGYAKAKLFSHVFDRFFSCFNLSFHGIGAIIFEHLVYLFLDVMPVELFIHFVLHRPVDLQHYSYHDIDEYKRHGHPERDKEDAY